MSDVSLSDVVAACYQLEHPPPPPTRANSVLLLIDIQHLSSPDYFASRAIERGLDEEGVRNALADYGVRFDAAVERCAALLAAARASGVLPIHVRIEALSTSARDTGSGHARLGWRFPVGGDASRPLPGFEPQPGEIALTKTVSGAFTGTNLDTILRHMGIQYLFMSGFMADECVETTARVATDLGYIPVLARDATTTYHQEDCERLMRKFDTWNLVMPTAGIIDVFAAMNEQ